MSGDCELEDVPLDENATFHALSRDLQLDGVPEEDEEHASDMNEEDEQREQKREELTADAAQALEGSLSEAEEKAQLINQILELQSTLEDLSRRVEGVTEENMKFKSENQVLAQYIENLMASSNTFQNAAKQRPKENS